MCELKGYANVGKQSHAVIIVDWPRHDHRTACPDVNCSPYDALCTITLAWEYDAMQS